MSDETPEEAPVDDTVPVEEAPAEEAPSEEVVFFGLAQVGQWRNLDECGRFCPD